MNQRNRPPGQKSPRTRPRHPNKTATQADRAVNDDSQSSPEQQAPKLHCRSVGTGAGRKGCTLCHPRRRDEGLGRARV